MSNINQTIIIRTDLFKEGHVGLISAQVAHIHAEMVLSNMNDLLQIKLDDSKVSNEDFLSWMKNPYIFVKKVPNKEGLDYFAEAARAAKIEVTEWRDTVYVNLSSTQDKAFENVLVGISLGPTDADKIRTVIGDLPLL